MSDPDIPPRASSGSTTAWTVPAALPLLLLLLGSLVANAVGVTWGLPNTVDWSLDSVAPHRVLHAMEKGFSNGWWDRYPPLHLALLAALYAPWLAFLRATGRLGTGVTLEELADPLDTFGDLILIARVVSVAMGVGVVLLVYLAGRRLFDPRAGFFAGLVVALNHPLVYYAHSANVDVPYLFWFTLAIYWFVGVLERGAFRDYVLFGVFATFAVCTKDQAYGLFVLSPLAVLWARGREGPAGEPPARRVADGSCAAFSGAGRAMSRQPASMRRCGCPWICGSVRGWSSSGVQARPKRLRPTLPDRPDCAKLLGSKGFGSSTEPS